MIFMIFCLILSLYVNIVFTITDGPGPGAYETVVKMQGNESQYVSGFNRTTSPAIKQKIYPHDSKHDRVPFHRHRPGPGVYNASQTKDMMAELSRKESRRG